MDAVGLLQRLHQHRAWVNRNMLTAAAQLSAEQLRAPFQIGQGSVWKSLVHLYAAEYVWLEALLGNEDTVVQLDEIVYRKSANAGSAKRFGSRRSDVLLHVCTHASCTTAQVVTMLRQAGVEKFPDVMLIAMARQEAK